MRKTAVFLAIVMLFTMWVPSMAGEEENKVFNPGFETIDAGKPVGWTTTDWSSVLVEESGNNYVNLVSSGLTVSSQTIAGLQGGSNYCVSFRYKAGIDGSALIYIYEQSSGSTIDNYSISLTQTNSLWRASERMFTLDERADSVYIALRSHPGAANDPELCYDDIYFSAYGESISSESVQNGDMEAVSNVSEGVNLPDEWVMTSGTAGVNHFADIANFRSGTASYKLTNASYSEASAYNRVSLPETESSYGIQYEISAYFKLTDLYLGAGETGGAKLSVYFSDMSTPNKASTAYFTTVNTEKWIKISTAVRAKDSSPLFLKIELTGKGTVYFDDISVKKNLGIINGDFEGLSGVGVPGCWESYNITNIWKTGSNGTLATDPVTGNKYAEFKNLTRSAYIHQPLYSLETGKTYKLSFDFKSSTTSIGVQVTLSGHTGISSNSQIWTKKGNPDTWTRQEMYFVMDSRVGGIGIQFHPHGSSPVPCAFDNIKLEKVSEAAGFYQGETKIEDIASGMVTAKYIRPESNFASPVSVTMITAVYKHNGDGTKSLQSLNTDVGTAAVITNAVGGGTSAIAGQVPVILSRTAEVPGESGPYSVEAFFWDGLTQISPLYEKAVLD